MSNSAPVDEANFHPVGELYGRWALNFLVDLAHAVAHDFVVRPRHYRAVPDDVASILADFRFKMGTDPRWPDAFQRTLSFKMLHRVCLASAPLRNAAMAYQQRTRELDEPLAETYRQTTRDFREQAGGMEGASLATVSYQTASIFESAKAVFSCPEVAQAFGLAPAPQGWPLGGDFSGAAAELVDEVVKTLRRVRSEAGEYRRIGENNPAHRPLVPAVTVAMSAEKFLTLQRAAYYGARTISEAMTDDFDPERHAASQGNALSWTRALQKLVPDVVRAWKDIDYRSRLTDLEWGMAPNPAGDPVPEIFSANLAASTYTVSGEVCCCSGDLDCQQTPTTPCDCTDHCTATICTQGCVVVAP